MTTYATETRPTYVGIVLALYPSDVRNHIEIQRAPDSGGSPDTGNAVTIGLASPGQRTYTDLRSSGTWHYRIRHVRPGATESSWLDWQAYTPAPIPAQLPQIPDVGGWIIKQGKLESTDGNIILDAPNENIRIGAATDPTTGTGVFIGSDGSTGYDFRAGNPAGNNIHWDESAGTLTITGEITATTGEIGGWSITATDIFSGNIALESDTERILVGSATAPLTGAGVFLGLSGGQYQFRAGDPGGDYLLWDGSALVLAGQIIDSGNLVDGAVTTIKINDEAITESKAALGVLESRLIWGWQGSQTFPTSTTIAGANEHTFDSPGSGRAVVRVLLLDAEGAGQVALNGTSIGTNLSGPNNTAKWYVLVTDALVEGENTLAFWSTTTDGITLQGIEVYASTAGLADTTENVRGLITADHILAGTLTANEVATNTLTASQIASLSFSGKTATFDTGSIGGWLMSASTLSSGDVTIDAANEIIRLGATAFLSGAAGVWMGSDGAGGFDFRVGNPAGEYIAFDESAGTFEVNVESFTASNPVFDGTVSVLGGRGGEVVRLTGAGASGVIGEARFYDTGTITGQLSVIPGGFLIDAPASILSLDAATEIQIRQNVLPLSDDTYDIGSLSERIGGIYTNTLTASAIESSRSGGGVPLLGFFSATPVTGPRSVTGSTDTTKIDSLLTELATLGLITDDTT